MLFIVKEALLHASKSTEGPEMLAFGWFWLSFEINTGYRALGSGLKQMEKMN